MEATALMQEWIREIGTTAGLHASNTRLSTGAIGAPESRIEMEVTFDSVADWELFLARIPFTQHKAWSQRIQGMVVDGSPRWEVLRSVLLELGPAAPDVQLPAVQDAPAPGLSIPGLSFVPSSMPATKGRSSASPAAAQPAGSSSSPLFIPDLNTTSLDDLLAEVAKSSAPPPSQPAAPAQPAPPASTPRAPSPELPPGMQVPEGAEVMLDWKGDPIIIRPGDKMPKFL